MIPSITYTSIEIFSENIGNRKSVFFWKFGKINFLLGKNDSGKTTFFHIMKDLMGNPNVAGLNTTGSAILTEDLLLLNLDIILKFDVGNNSFYTTKKYTQKSKQTFYTSSGDWIGGIDSFLSYLEEKNILSLPEVRHSGIKKITLNSLMRFCFIEQNHFGNSSKVEKHRSSNWIIKHNNDGRTKVLLYMYLLNIVSDGFTLTQYYEKLTDFSQKETRIKEIKKQLELMTHINYDGNTGLFDDRDLLRAIHDFEGKRRQLLLDNSSYEDIYDNLAELLNFSRKSDNQTINDYCNLLEEDKHLIAERIIDNKNRIEEFVTKINENKNKIKIIDQMLLDHFLVELNKLESNEKDIFKLLTKESESIRTELIEYQEFFGTLVILLNSSGSFELYKKMIVELNLFLGNIDNEIDLSNGKYSVSTTADSINRIILFNILLGFIFLKNKLYINHPGFIFFDSPFVGLDKDNEIRAIKNFLENEELYNGGGQFFISLNPEQIDINTLIGDNINIATYIIKNKLLEI